MLAPPRFRRQTEQARHFLRDRRLSDTTGYPGSDRARRTLALDGEEQHRRAISGLPVRPRTAAVTRSRAGCEQAEQWRRGPRAAAVHMQPVGSRGADIGTDGATAPGHNQPRRRGPGARARTKAGRDPRAGRAPAARQQRGSAPRRPSAAATERPEGPGFLKTRVHANLRRRPDPRPRFHAARGPLAANASPPLANSRALERPGAPSTDPYPADALIRPRDAPGETSVGLPSL